MKKIIFLFASLVFLVIVAFFITNITNDKEQVQTLNKEAPSEENIVTESAKEKVSSSLISLVSYEPSVFSVPTSIKEDGGIALKWTNDDDLEYWGNTVYICLIGLNEQGEPIDLVDNDNLCYPDMQIILDTTTLTSGEYSWETGDFSDKFIVKPDSYKLSIRVIDSLPAEGMSEWAGLIAESTSNKFVIE